MGDDDGFDSGDVGGLLFGYLLYRELQSGRLDAGGCLRAGCLVAILIGAVLGGLLLLAALATSSQRYAVDPDPRPTHAAYIGPGPPSRRSCSERRSSRGYHLTLRCKIGR